MCLKTEDSLKVISKLNWYWGRVFYVLLLFSILKPFAFRVFARFGHGENFYISKKAL